MTHRTAILAGCLLAVAAIAPACGSDPELDAVNDFERASLTATDVGAGWTLELPEDWIVGGSFGDPVEREPGCVVDQISVSHGNAYTEVALLGPGCSASAVGRGNGEPPTFGSADQLIRGATGVDKVDTALGTLTIATVDYFECTNECDYYKPLVGLIELTDPADPSLPTVVISDDYATTSQLEIEFIAGHLSYS